MQQASHSKRFPPIGWLGLLLWSLLLLLPGLTSLPPLDRDEPRFAQASKQMLTSGNYHDIFFQEEPRYKKPIGIYWLQSLSNAGFGTPPYDAIWPYRLPSLLGGIFALVLTAWGFSRVTGWRHGLFAAVILGCSPLFILEGHLAKTDAALLACLTGAQLILLQAYVGTIRARAAYGFWLLQATAILIKGPVAPLYSLLTIGSLLMTDRNVRWLHGLRWRSGLALCALVVAPWFVAIGLASAGNFYREAVGHDFLGKLFSGQDRGALPPGYHSALLPLLFVPQLGLVVTGIVGLWRTRQEPMSHFLLAWIVPAWLLYEIVPTKLPHYVLPCYPALACAAALALLTHRLPQGRVWRFLVRLQFGLLGTGALALGGTGWWLGVASLWPYLLSFAAFGLFWWQARHFWHRPITSCLSGAAASLVLAYGFWSLLPATQSLWLTPQISRAYFSARPCPLLSRLVTEGYNEPSIVFSAGTFTRFGNGGGAAAKLLAGDRCGVAVVRADLRAGFFADLTLLDTEVEEVGVVQGLHYNGGGWQTYSLYRARPAEPLWFNPRAPTIKSVNPLLYHNPD